MSEQMFWIQTGIAALIAFGATFFGVFISFWVERRRREAEDKERFGRMLRGVLAESANNYATLGEIRNQAVRGRVPIHQLHSDALEAALRDSLFHRMTGISILVASLSARDRIAAMNNILSFLREQVAAGQGTTDSQRRGLQIRAGTGLEIIRVMETLMDEATQRLNLPAVADDQITNVQQRLVEIVRRERKALEAPAQPDPGTAESIEEGDSDE